MDTGKSNAKGDKPEKVNALLSPAILAAISAVVAGSTAAVVGGVNPAGGYKKKSYPTYAFTCPACELPYAPAASNPDLTKFQVHGFPTSIDGKEVWCTKVKNQAALNLHIERRKDKSKGGPPKKA